MSKWGEKFTVNGNVFVPHIKTECFSDVVPDDVIDDIFLIHAINVDEADEALTKLKSDYIGKPYSSLSCYT